MVAFVASLLITVAHGRRRRARAPGAARPARPLTWGEAFVAATFVFALLFMAYGVVPHQWLAWADNELGWRNDKLGIPSGRSARRRQEPRFDDGITFGGRRPLHHHRPGAPRHHRRRHLRRRPRRPDLRCGRGGRSGARSKPTAELETSAYGRPLVRRA